MLVLDEWQKEVLEYKGDILVCKGRRIGATQIFAIKAAERMVNQPGVKIVMISLTEDQAKLILTMCLDYLTEKYPKLIATGLKKPTQEHIYLKNSSSIMTRAVGQTGKSVRGFDGDILGIDEAPWQPAMMWAAARPIITTNAGELWLWGTPAAKEGYFWEQFDRAYNKKDPEARFKVWYKTTEDVLFNRPINDTWTQKQREGAVRILKEEQKSMTAKEYGNEFLGLFLEDLQQFFPTELIRKVMTLDRGLITSSSVEENFLGVDVGSLEDPSVLVSVKRNDDKTKYKMFCYEIIKKALLRETTIKIKQSDEQYDYKGIFIDSTGIGLGCFQELMYEDKTRGKTHAVENSARPLDRSGKEKKRILKEDLYANLKLLMEQGNIDLINTDDVFDSLSSVQYEMDKETRQVSIFGRNTHLCEALIRAVSPNLETKSLNLWCAYSNHGI